MPSARHLRDFSPKTIANAIATGRKLGLARNTALDRLARQHGWMRVVLPDGKRGWVTQAEYEAMPKRGYRYATGDVKRKARLKVPAKRRRQIALQGSRRTKTKANPRRK